MFTVEEAASAQASLNSGSDDRTSVAADTRRILRLSDWRFAARAYQVEANNPK